MTLLISVLRYLPYTALRTNLLNAAKDKMREEAIEKQE